MRRKYKKRVRLNIIICTNCLGSYYSYKNLEGIFVILVDLLSGSTSRFGESSFVKSLTASLLLPVSSFLISRTFLLYILFSISTICDLGATSPKHFPLVQPSSRGLFILIASPSSNSGESFKSLLK